MNEHNNVTSAFRVVQRNWVEKENQLKSDVKDLTNNQYMRVIVKNGGVHETEILSRSIGYYTLGLSLFFTEPTIIVKGARSPENVRCLERLRGQISSYIEDQLTV